MAILFFFLAGLYFLIARKVDYWITMDLLGFKSQCPTAFLQREQVYHYAVWFLFLLSLVVGIISPLRWWVVVPLLLVLWVFSGSSGHKAAYQKYREIIRSLRATAESSDEVAEMDAALAKSDAELREMVYETAKFR